MDLAIDRFAVVAFSGEARVRAGDQVQVLRSGQVIWLAAGPWILEAGDAIVLAFSAADSRELEWGGVGPVVEGVPPLGRPAVEMRRRTEIAELRHSFARCEEYALSLKGECVKLEGECGRVEQELAHAKARLAELEHLSRSSISTRIRRRRMERARESRGGNT